MPEWMVQGAAGPEPARRPPPLELELLTNSGVPFGERWVLAQQLSRAGYVVDVPIDLWGWDYGRTMALRRAYGYTWVPHAGMPPVQVQPGLAVPGVPSYSPRPPFGAILVPPPAS